MAHITADIVSGNNSRHMGVVFGGEGGKEQCVIKTSVGWDFWDETHVQGTERRTQDYCAYKPK